MHLFLCVAHLLLSRVFKTEHHCERPQHKLSMSLQGRSAYRLIADSPADAMAVNCRFAAIMNGEFTLQPEAFVHTRYYEWNTLQLQVSKACDKGVESMTAAHVPWKTHKLANYSNQACFRSEHPELVGSTWSRFVNKQAIKLKTSTCSFYPIKVVCDSD